MRTALTGRTHGCTDQPLRREDSPCQLEAVHTWHYSDIVPCRLEFRLRRDSVAKLGKRRLTRNNRIGAKDLLNLEGSVRSSGMTPAAPRGPRPHRSRIERSRARWGYYGDSGRGLLVLDVGPGLGRASGRWFVCARGRHLRAVRRDCVSLPAWNAGGRD